jgi:hypothetical protein
MAKLTPTSDGFKCYVNDVEITHGIKINRHGTAVGTTLTEPKCLIFPPYVKAIENGTFQDIESLEAIYIPESVKRIGLNAFAGCTRLYRVIVQDSVQTIVFKQPQGKWDINTGRPFNDLAEMLRKGGYVVHLYKSGENFSWD